MAECYYIGVDGGSQSTKVSLFDEKGVTILFVQKKIRPTIFPASGHVEHPDDDLWDSLKAALQELMNKFTGDITKVRALGLCSIRCCRAFLKKDGTLARPIMSWMDVRAYEKYRDHEEICYTCAPSGYLTQRLTGNFIDTVANTFQYQYPIDMDTWQWSTDDEYLKSFAIPKEKLLPLVLPGSILGYVTKKAANETMLPVGLPIVGTGNDKAVEALGAGLIYENVGLVSLGTYLTSMVCGKINKINPVNYFTNFACVPYKYLYESTGIRLGMSHVTWFKGIISEWIEWEEHIQEASFEEFLGKEAEKVPAGSDGLLTIPDWLAPADKLYRKGVMIGFSAKHTRAHMYRSLLEGIAMTLKGHFDNMLTELVTSVDKLIISGGGSNSTLFMQIFADMYGIKTVRNENNNAAGVGAAICAAVAVGDYSSFAEAVKNMVRERDEFFPNVANQQKYNNIERNVYNNLPTLLEPALKQIWQTFSHDE